MPKRVVLAYSGGLDTSVAVRWMREEWGVEVVASAVDVGQLAEGEEAIIRERRRPPARSRSRSSTRARVRARLPRAGAPRQRALRRQVSARVRASRPVIVEHLVASAPSPWRRRGRPRLHRQGQRPGAVRGVVAHPRARSRRAWRRCGCGAHPRRLHRARGEVGHPDLGVEGEALLDRREHVGPGDRVRRPREPVGDAARGAVHADAPSQGRAARSRATSSSPSSGAFRSRSTARRSVLEIIDELGAIVGAYGWGRIDMVENRRVGSRAARCTSARRRSR